MKNNNLKFILVTLLMLLNMNIAYSGILSSRALLNLIAVVTSEESVKLNQMVGTSVNLEKEIEFLKDIYKTADEVLGLIDIAVEADEILMKSADIYIVYLNALKDVTNSKVPLTSDEVAYFKALMDQAAFHPLPGKKPDPKITNIGGGEIKQFKEILELSKKDKNVQFFKLTNKLKEIKKNILKTHARTVSCKRYINSIIIKKEQEAGIYDMQRIINKVDSKFKKLDK